MGRDLAARCLLWCVVVLGAVLGCASGGVQPLEVPEQQAAASLAGQVTASDYSPHLDVLALGFKDGTFELRSPAPAHVLSRGKHAAEVVNVALAPDARRLASADAAGTVALSAVHSGELEVLASSLPLPARGLIGLAWETAGRRLAISAGRLVRVIDVETGAVRETQLKENIGALAFWPDGSRLLAAGRALHVLTSDELRLDSNQDFPLGTARSLVTDLRFSPDGKRLAVLMLGGAAFIDVESRETELVELRQLNPVGVRFGGDGRLAVFGRRALYVGPAIGSRIAVDAHDTQGDLWDVEFRKDGSLLFVGDAADQELAAVVGAPALGPEQE